MSYYTQANLGDLSNGSPQLITPFSRSSFGVIPDTSWFNRDLNSSKQLVQEELCNSALTSFHYPE